MRRFLRETWDLWYWAMFCPSKLQQRINEWVPTKDKDGQKLDTKFIDALTRDRRFVLQYLLLWFVQSLPLITIIIVDAKLIDLVFLLTSMLMTFGTNIESVPIGIHIPLIWNLIYIEKPKLGLVAIQSELRTVNNLFVQLPQLFEGIFIGVLILITIIILQRCKVLTNRIITLIGGTLTVSLGSWIATTNLGFTLFISGTTALSLLMLLYPAKAKQEPIHIIRYGVSGVLGSVMGSITVFILSATVANVSAISANGFLSGILGIIVAGVPVIIVGVAAGILAGGMPYRMGKSMVGIVTGIMIGTVLSGLFSSLFIFTLGTMAAGVASIATLSLPSFLLVCWLISFSGSPVQGKWMGIILAVLLSVLGFENLGWKSLLAVPVVLISYYRIVPDTLIFTPLSFLPSVPVINYLFPQPLQLLKLLPPHISELLWLPLPNHDQILAAAFRQNSSAALLTFQQMQALHLPGFQSIIKKALPQMVADQLTAVYTIPELLATAKPEHPLLPLLVPIFYQPNTELEEHLKLKTVSSVTKAVNNLVLIGSVALVATLISGTLLLLLDTFWAVLLGSTLSAILGQIVTETLLNDWSGKTEDGNEINRLLPRLQTVAQDVNAVLNVGSAALKDRGLERILNNLGMLKVQLPELELKASAIKRWEPVIKRWQGVIELELKEQHKQSQGELLNPFQYGNPLRRDRAHLFKGRQALADAIVRLVLDSNSPTLVLHGPRRFGKSSFLLNLPRLLPSDMLPIYLDMQSAAVTTDEAAFCQGLVRAISKDSRSQGVKLPAVPQRQEFLATPYIALEDWLEQALPQLGDRRLLLNLDEFEKIGSAINEGRMSLNVFNELRHLIQHYEQLGFLFSGVQTLDEFGPNWSSYFISVVPIEMLYLEPSEAEDLLLNPDPEFSLRYNIGIVEEILTLTRCHPYLLQLIGWSLINLANENHTQLVTSNLLQAAILEAFTNGQPYFTNVWTEFTGISSAEVKAGQELLSAIAQGHQQPSSATGDEIVQAARRRLLRYHVIEHRNGSDRFEIPLIEHWVRERAVRN